MTSEEEIASANRALRRAMRIEADEANVWAGLLGSIPTEETDEEFAAAMEAFELWGKPGWTGDPKG